MIFSRTLDLNYTLAIFGIKVKQNVAARSKNYPRKKPNAKDAKKVNRFNVRRCCKNRKQN